MRHRLVNYLKITGLLFSCSLSITTYAQQMSKVIIVHPAVGETIDQQEKLAFGLFPTYKLQEFQEASFLRFASLDSTQGSILVRITLRDGGVRTRSYSEREFQQIRNSIERQYRAVLADQQYKAELTEQERKRQGRQIAIEKADSITAPRYWYVGVGATYHHYNSVNRPYSRVEPLYLAVGYTIKPKLALQGEIRYGRQVTNSSNTSLINGETHTYRTRTETRSTAATLLLRFREKSIRQRLQFDWLGGFTIVHGREDGKTFQTSATYSQTYNYPAIKATQLHLAGGVSLRYLLTPHVALGTQLVANKNVVPLFFGYGRPSIGIDVGVSYLIGNKRFAPTVKK